MISTLLISELEYIEQKISKPTNELIFETAMRCGDVKTDDIWGFASKQVTQSIKRQCENAKHRYKHIIEMINQQNHIDTAIKLAKIFQVYKKD
jgi:hypothetical protein